MSISEESKNKLLRLAKIQDEGSVGIARELNTLEDRVDEQRKYTEDKIRETDEKIGITDKKIDATVDSLDGKLDKIITDVTTPISQVMTFKNAELVTIKGKSIKGDPGLPGYTPIKGKDYFDGKDYILTDRDKKEIAQSITVPIVEKIIEKVEVIKEQPIIKTEIIKETTIDKTETPETIADKINTLDEKIKPEVLVGWSDLNRIIHSNAHLPNDFDVRIGVSKTEIKRLTDRVIVLEQNPGGGTWGSITGTLSSQTDLQTALDAKANTSGALTQFLGNGNWKVWYSDGSGDVKELSLGADGTFLKSNGASSAPTFATPSGSGDVSKVGTPVNNQLGVWTGDGTIEGTSSLTFDGKTLTLAGSRFFPSIVLGDINGSFSIGDSTNIADGDNSFAVGYHNVLNGGFESSAVGSNNTVDGEDDHAYGEQNTVGGSAGFAFGRSNSVGSFGKIGSYAIGNLNVVTGVNAGYAFGKSNTITADGAYIFGGGITNAVADSLMIGPSNTVKVTLLSTNNLLFTGDIGATATRITKGWFTDLQVTNAIAGSVTGNAATVTTNANLTGPITSTGNATAIASQTGTGTKFVVDTSPTLVTPVLGVATATSVNGLAITTLANAGKSMSVQGNWGVGYAKWDFSVDGGATGTITPAITSTIPANAIIHEGIINSTTAVTSGGTTTIAIGVANDTTNRIQAATGKATYSINAVFDTTRTFASPGKTTAGGSITFTIATTAATAGVVEVWVYYFTANA